MTFTELRTDIMDRLNLSSSDASTRIGRAINRTYRKVTSAIGLQLSRRSTVQQAVTMGVSTVAFSNCEKVISVVNRNVTPYRTLEEVTLDELQADMPFGANDTPLKWAVHSHTSDTVTILIGCVPQTGFTLYADVHQAVSDLSGSNEPAFPESFHDVIIEGVLADEYRKLEKLQFAQLAQREYERILSDLRMWIAKSNALEIYQGKTATSTQRSGGSGGASGSSFDGAQSWTQTGLVTFDRDPSAPFAVSASSAKVDNLDADLLDGYNSDAFPRKAENATISGNWEFDGTVAFDGAVDHDSSVDISGGTLILPQSTSPAQTAEGSMVWDTDDNLLTVGDGASRKTLVNTDTAQTLTNKTLTSPGITTPTITSPSITSGAIDLQSGQIAFPATQAASGGANTLDDYEEGSWTPGMSFNASSSGVTYGLQTGFYVKIGQLVFCQGRVTLTSNGSGSGQARITGLPFTSTTSSAGSGTVVIASYANCAAAVVGLGGYVESGATAVVLLIPTTANATAATDTHITDTADLIFSITYRASA